MVLRRRTGDTARLHRLQRGRRCHRLRRLKRGRLRRGRLRRDCLSLLCLSLLSFDSLILLGERGLRLGRCRYRGLRGVRYLVLNRTLRRLLIATAGLCRLRLVVHRVAHRTLYLLRGYLLIGCLVRGNLLIHRLVLLLQHLPPNLTRATARRAQRREKRYRRAD